MSAGYATRRSAGSSPLRRLPSVEARSSRGGRGLAVLLLVACAALISVPAFAERGEAPRLHRLFDQYWAWVKREGPEQATYFGDDRYNDRLTDLSAEAIERRKAYRHGLLAQLRRFDPARLSDQDRVSLAVLQRQLELQGRVDAFPDERMAASQMFGPHLEFAGLIKATPFRHAADYERYLQRLRALAVQLGQVEALMRQGLTSGWVLPAQPIARVPGQITAWVADDVEQSPAWLPFAQFPKGMPGAEQGRLAAAAKRAIADDMIPAFRRLKAFVETAYLPAARKDIGASTLPGGPAYYAGQIARQTTTALSAQAIHDLGLSEVERIGVELDAAMRGTGFTGTRAEFFGFLRDSPQFYDTRPEVRLAAYRDLAKRVDAQLPKIFAELPRLPYGVRAMEAFEGDNADRYTPGSPAAGRGGYFEANTNNLRTRPKYDMEAVFFHEAVPGHHCRSRARRSSTACRSFGSMRSSSRTPKAGRCMRRASATSLASTPTPIRDSAA